MWKQGVGLGRARGWHVDYGVGAGDGVGIARYDPGRDHRPGATALAG